MSTAAAKRATDPPISVVVPLLQEFPAAIERLGTKLDDLVREVIRAQQGIERLVALEDERRVAERQMEALAVALTPVSEDAPGDIVYADWFRDPDGAYRVRDRIDGTSRPMTPAEIKALTTPSRRR